MLSPTPVKTAAFDALASQYDRVFTDSLIGRAQREAVWNVAAKVFRPGTQLLELNCGTGVDAAYFASLGLEILALDSSSRMIEIARNRMRSTSKDKKVRLRQCALEDLDQLGEGATFGGVFSNFGGLNCVADLPQFGQDLSRWVRPRSPVLLCLLNRYCPWELVYYLLRFRFDKAFRRWKREGALANLGNKEPLQVYYPSVSQLCRALQPHFRYRGHQAIGLCVPPSYLESWVQGHTRFLKIAQQIDRRAGNWPLFRNAGDHYLVCFERL